MNEPPSGDEMKKMCWFGYRCFRENCKFQHSEFVAPPKCRFGLRCKKDNCSFRHSDDCENKLRCVEQNCSKRHHKTEVEVKSSGLENKKNQIRYERDHVGFENNGMNVSSGYQIMDKVNERNRKKEGLRAIEVFNDEDCNQHFDTNNSFDNNGEAYYSKYGYPVKRMQPFYHSKNIMYR